MAQSKLKSGKPIARQQEARKRKFLRNPYWDNLKRKKLLRVRKSCGLVFAKKWAKDKGMVVNWERLQGEKSQGGKLHA